MFSAIVAVGLFWNIRNNKTGFLRIFVYILIALLTGISDPFLLVYFGAIILSDGMINKKIRRFLASAAIILSALAGILINAKTNIAVKIQTAHSFEGSDVTGNLIKFYDIVGLQGVLFLFLVPLLCTTYSFRMSPHGEYNKNDVVTFSVASIIVILFVGMSGIVKDIYGMRYLCLIAPLYIYIVTSFLIEADSVIRWCSRLGYIFIIAASLLWLVSDQKNPISIANKSIIYCDEIPLFLREPFLSEYWGAKIIFEMLGRKNTVYQVSSSLDKYTWNFNEEWIHAFPPNPAMGHFILILPLISPQIIKNLESAITSTYCNGAAVEIDCKEALRLLPDKKPIRDVCP